MSAPSDWRLTPKNSALVVIDVQQRLMSAMARREPTIAAIDKLIRAAGILELPALVTLQYVKGLGPLCDELAESAGKLPAFEKLSFSCAGCPPFNESLEKLRPSHAILCGVETHVCVAQTALDLIERGLKVTLAVDATCSRRDEDRDIALRRLENAGVALSSVEAIAFELLREAGTAAFKQMLPLFK